MFFILIDVRYRYLLGSVLDPNPDPHWICIRWAPGMRIRIQKRENQPKKNFFRRPEKMTKISIFYAIIF
jgi:hypothetical protein